MSDERIDYCAIPPRIRGIVERFESAVRAYARSVPPHKSVRRKEMEAAKRDVLHAFALLTSPCTKEQERRTAQIFQLPVGGAGVYGEKK